MGPCASGEDGGDGWGNRDNDGLEDMTRVRRNKHTGEFEEMDDYGREDNDCFEFEAEEVRTGEQFLSVRPWKAAAAIEPTNHPPVNDSKPDETYTLEHVYGYRCQDSK